MNNNNNNNYSPQQNIVKSPIAYPIQLSQNLNCGFFIILNKPPFYSMPFYNYLPLYQMAYQQNPQASIINVNNNDKAENQTNYNYNYYYNNTNPYYSFYYNNNSIPSVNNQENVGPTTPAPPPQETLFLNKKRTHLQQSPTQQPVAAKPLKSFLKGNFWASISLCSLADRKSVV